MIGAYLDHDVLIRLIGSTSEGAGVRFARDFSRMWEIRVARLNSALERRDFNDADVVLLSIRSGSTMLGAEVLEAISGMIHSQVKANNVEGSRFHLRRFLEVGEVTRAELDAVLRNYERAQPSSEAASR